MPVSKRLISILLIGLAGFSAAGAAQTTADQPPGATQDYPRSLWERLLHPYDGDPARPVSYQNSPRLENLIREGKLFLSLDDALALALENNLDIELQRFTPELAYFDLFRAKGGGLLRGLSLNVNEVPPGVGGPAGPILNLPATGAPFSSSVSTTLPELTSIVPFQSNAGITGSTALSSGPPIPVFEPSLFGTLNTQRQETPQISPQSQGTNDLTTRSTVGNIGFQKGFSSGAQFTAGFNSLFVHSNSATNAYNPYNLSSLGLNLSQPLLRGFGPSVNKRFILIAQNNQKVGDLVFRQQVISTVYGVVRLYFDLVALHEDVHVKQQTVSLAQKLYDDNKDKVEQGTLAPIELVRAQAQIASARQDLANSEGFERQQELVLKNIISRRGTADIPLREARITPTTPIEVPPREELPPIQELIETAHKNRPELEEGRLQLSNSEISLKGARNGLLPDLDLVVVAQNNALAGRLNSLGLPPLFDPALVGGFGSSLGQLFRSNYPTYGIGLQLNLPLRNNAAEADYARDAIQYRQTQVRYQQLENQVRLEVESALTALERSRGAYDAAAEARRLQEQSLQIEMEKYANGVSTNFLVMQYQSFLAQARSTEVAAKSVYVKAKTALERAVGMTLENHDISLDEARRGQVARPPSTPPPEH